jgi:CRISPR-associated protein (TIGR03986 family)
VAEFINPYTFVPLPAVINRFAGTGHHCAGAGNVSGRMTVTWTLRTPLLLPAAYRPAPDGRVVLPGSSVKGAVRSLHETLMGGCLRVMDEDFVPVYREPAVVKDDNWQLAVVSDATRQGRATRVRLAEETAWVPVGMLRQALGRVPRTGDTVDIEDWAIRTHEGLGRQQVSDSAGVIPGEGWVLLVGDSGTRLKSKQFFCAAGRMPDDDDDSHEVPVSAWAEYEQICEGANDLRVIRQKPDAPAYKGWRSGRVFAKVGWPASSDVVGERRRVTGRLWPGDVVWAAVNPSSGVVEHLSMAAVWRRPGEGPLAGRIPDAVKPCRDPSGLCVSCRMFGSADTGGAEPGVEADQRAYAGHLRIGDAVAEGVTIRPVRLAPLGAPRPGAGQFYLQIARTDPASDETELPSAYWGSEQDRPESRDVRGRKFYWHGDPALQRPPRHLARPGQRNEAMTGERHLVPAATCFRQDVAFDNVSRAELGSVLLTLMPRLVLPRTEGRQTADYLLWLGGGKPLGLGSCAVEVTGLQWHEPRERYLGQPAATQSAEDFFSPIASDVAQLAGRPVWRHWPTLSRIMRADAVEAELIWYPLGGDWTDERNRDRAFRFFARTNGRHLQTRTEPIRPLPDPSPGHDQRLPSV